MAKRAKELEGEVNKLRDEVKALKDRIPQEFLQQLGDATSAQLSEENELDEERSSRKDEDLFLIACQSGRKKNPEKLGMLEAYLEH